MSAENLIEIALAEFDGSPTALANAIGDGVVRQQVEHWVKSGKVPPAHGAAFERATGIQRWRLFPTTWHRIWPELIGVEGAPEVPAERVS